MPLSGARRVQNGIHKVLSGVAVAAVLGSGCAQQPAAPPQSTISYGRVTAVSLVTVNNQRAQATGAVLGGIIGLAAGGNYRAVAGVGGAVVGHQIGRVAGRSKALEYTILIGGTTTVTMITDESGFRIGDCVAVERGTFNNLRLADDAQCDPGAKPTTADLQQANACVAAKENLLSAKSDEDFDRAERSVRLLCADWSNDLLFY